MEFEEALEKCGTMGKAQMILILIANCLFALTGWQQLITVFAGRDVDFYCQDKHTKTANQSFNAVSLFDNQCVEGCSKYIYRSEVSSIMQDFNLYCGANRAMRPFVHSSYWLGFAFSTLYGGYLGDKFGRKTTSMVSNGIYILASILTIISPNIECLLAFRVLTGLCQGAFFSLVYLIVLECVSKRHIATVEYIAQFFYAVGEIIAVTIGYLIKFSWKFQIMCISIALGLFFIMCFFLLPESPRWLYSQRRYQDTKKVFDWFGKLNKKDTSSITFEHTEKPQFNVQCTSDNERYTQNDEECEPLQKSPNDTSRPNILALFQTLSGFLASMTQLILWISIGLIYSGLFYDAANIGSNFYVSSALLAASEMPVVFLFVIINKYGRKRPLIYCLTISTISSAILPFIGTIADGKLQVSVAVVSKLAATGCISIMFIYTPEMFPTVLRSSALNFCLFVQEMAIFTAPIFLEYSFGPYNCSTFIIFAVSGAIGTLTLCFFGRETLGVPLFDTVRQYHEFVR